jgi:hypothetical protein
VRTEPTRALPYDKYAIPHIAHAGAGAGWTALAMPEVSARAMGRGGS